MRTSVGPNRSNNKLKPSPAVPEVSLCVVTHMTSHPYHAQRMDVVKLCLDTLVKGARGYNTELIIWDNGSTIPAFIGLLQSYMPNVFIRSENMGGYNGRRGMLGVARGKYACITDDDILFAPNWLTRQLEILHAFGENVVATGVPRDCRASLDHLRSLAPETKVWRGSMLPSEWIKDLWISVGTNTGRAKDVLVERGKVRGWICRVDMQMLGETKTLLRAHAPYCKVIGTSGDLCQRMENDKLVQVATYTRTSHHIGNEIDPSITNIRRIMADDRPLIINTRGAEVLR